MKKSEFKRQGLATLKAGERVRAKRPKGLWPSEVMEAAGPATETACLVDDRRFKNDLTRTERQRVYLIQDSLVHVRVSWRESRIFH